MDCFIVFYLKIAERKIMIESTPLNTSQYIIQTNNNGLQSMHESVIVGTRKYEIKILTFQLHPQLY